MTPTAEFEKRGTVLYGDGALPGGTDTPLKNLPRRRRDLVLRCESGRRIEGEWTGVPVGALLETVDVPGATTHLLVESADEYRACVPISDALGALLAFEEERVDCAATAAVTPRLVGPRIDTPRAVKRVERIEAIRLRPGDAPTEYEHLPD